MIPPHEITLVAAMDERRVIGYRGKLPWNLPEELAHFKRLTTGGAVVMGRKTWESIGRPLPNRENIVVSKTMSETPGLTVRRTLPEALAAAAATSRPVYVIGGAEVFAAALPLASRLCLSVIPGEHEGDAFFPEFDKAEWALETEIPMPGFIRRDYRRIWNG